MSYHDLLMRYGTEAEDGEARINVYVRAPKALKNTKDIVYRDKSAEQDIKRLEKIIDNLKDYRKALAARYAQLETMTYTERLEIERYPGGNGIKFYIRIVRTYEDGTTENTLQETYTGKERHAAMKRFEELKKQHPGMEATKDLERRSWER